MRAALVGSLSQVLASAQMWGISVRCQSVQHGVVRRSIVSVATRVYLLLAVGAFKVIFPSDLSLVVGMLVPATVLRWAQEMETYRVAWTWIGHGWKAWQL